MKKVLVLIVAIVFTLGVAAMGFASDMKGSITKIEGDKITIKGADGKESTVQCDAKDLKVGDKVMVKDGKIKKKKAVEGC